MNRIIKFRAWNKKDKKMIYSSNFAYDSMFWMSVEIDSLMPKEDEHFVMQFTGLTDKNGKEIYESDLVEWEDKILEVKIGGYMGVRNGESYNEAGYGVYGSDKDEKNVVGIGCFDQDKSVEVIGNIYENPELVK